MMKDKMSKQLGMESKFNEKSIEYDKEKKSY